LETFPLIGNHNYHLHYTSFVNIKARIGGWYFSSPMNSLSYVFGLHTSSTCWEW